MLATRASPLPTTPITSREASTFTGKQPSSARPRARSDSRCRAKCVRPFAATASGSAFLHPPECAAMPCRIVQENGNVIEKPFPKQIAPAPKQDPFLEIREMSYEFAPGRFADLHFDGDVFETEDQRNWSDGSFKTFCTPLRLPFPVEVAAGTKIEQHVRLQLRGGVEGVHAVSAAATSPSWSRSMQRRARLCPRSV